MTNTKDIHRSLAENVFGRMRCDKLAKVVKSDRLIVNLGALLLHKLGPNRALDVPAHTVYAWVNKTSHYTTLG